MRNWTKDSKKVVNMVWALMLNQSGFGVIKLADYFS